MLVHRRVIPSIKFAGTHLYTWVERGTVKVKCLAQEHNTMSPARTRIRTTRSGVEHFNHELNSKWREKKNCKERCKLRKHSLNRTPVMKSKIFLQNSLELIAITGICFEVTFSFPFPSSLLRLTGELTQDDDVANQLWARVARSMVSTNRR